MTGSNVVALFDERWVEDVFVGGNLWVSISTKGRVRFVTGDGKPAVLSMEQMMKLGEVITVAFTSDREEEDNVERDPAE